jgi:N-acetylmuramic acid 6-phosphate etherase
MKSGTAQKLVLNMISTAVFIKMERVRGNKMIDMQLTNHKLINRGVDMIVQELSISEKEAEILLNKHGSVRKAIDEYNNG